MKDSVDFGGALSKLGKKKYLKKKKLLLRIMRLETLVGTLLSKIEKLEHEGVGSRFSINEEKCKIHK